MSKNKTEAYGRVITPILQNAGWELIEVQKEEDWFATEHWMFRSVEQAFGLSIFVSFMIDPLDETSKAVFCVQAGTEIPKRRTSSKGFITKFYLGGRGDKKDKIAQFVNELNDFRNQVQEGTHKQEA